jgi:hypothetical protein
MTLQKERAADPAGAPGPVLAIVMAVRKGDKPP